MQCRCIAYDPREKGSPSEILRCRNKTRRASGICASCRPIGRRSMYWCGPRRKLARVKKASSEAGTVKE